MKNIFKTATFLLLLSTTFSCGLSEIDNYEGPKETLKGTIIDKYTGEPIVTETGALRIKLEELSWSDTPTPQYFGNKQDGTFFNSMLFKGHYRIQAENGPFIPLSDTVEIDINGVTTHDFVVEPYLHLTLLDVQQEDTVCTVRFTISSETNMYKILDTRVFVNNTKFVGDGACIRDYLQTRDLSAVINEEIFSTEYSFKVDKLKRGRTFYMRVGARVDDPIAKKYNYSEIVEIKVP